MSTIIKNWSQWLVEARFSHLSEEQKMQTIAWLQKVRDKVLENARLVPGDTLIDIGSGTGLLAFAAYEILKDLDGRVILSDYADDCLANCKDFAHSTGIGQKLEFLKLDITDNSVPKEYVNVVVMKSVLVHILNKHHAFNGLYQLLKSGGRISFYEPIVSSNTKYYDLVDIHSFDLAGKVIEAEDFILSNPDDPLTNFNEISLIQNLEEVGFVNVKAEVVQEKSTYMAYSHMIEPWFNTPTSPGGPSTKDKLRTKLTEEEVQDYMEFLKVQLHNKEITVITNAVYMSGRKW